MFRYLRIYKKLLGLNFANVTAYRANFVNSIVASVGWGFISLYSIYLLTNKINTAYGWSRQEILLFNGLYGMIIGVFHMLISVNMRRFSRVIHLGDLDLILTKPIDSQFALSFWLVDFTIILRILMAGCYTLWFINMLGIAVTFVQILSVITIAFFSLVLLYSLWYSTLSVLIWDSSLSNLVLFLYSFESFARFPREVAQQLINVLFLILLPITLIINTPAHILMGKFTLVEIIRLLVLSTFFFYLSRRIWRFALRYYASASS